MIKYIQTKLNTGYITPPFPQWGVISKGIKVEKGGKFYPSETPHFNFNFLVEGHELSHALHYLYGDNPLQFEGVLYPQRIGVPPIEAFVPSSMQAWATSKLDPTKRTLMVECDGETVSRKFNTQTKHHEGGEGHSCEFNLETRQCGHGCKPTCKLVIILPELCKLVGEIGYFTMTLHSWGDILNITRIAQRVGDNVGTCLWRFYREPAVLRYTDASGAHERKHYPVKAVLAKFGMDLSKLFSTQPILEPSQSSQDTPLLEDKPDVYLDEPDEVVEVVDDTPDVNHSSHSKKPMNAPTGTQSNGTSLLSQVCEYLDFQHHLDVSPENVLEILGYADEAELIRKWDGERTVGVVAQRFVLKLSDMNF